MKLKTIVFLFALAAAAFIIGGAACSHSSKDFAPAGNQTAAYYTCPMHPSVKLEKPGPCPVCGMTLVPVYTNAPSAKP
jgi:Cu(I)/Ag(I) efflux system membrane fusion protein